MNPSKPATEERVAHTPGPWKLEPEIYGIDIVSHDDICIAEVPGLGRHDEQFEVKNWHQANAAFIVTACNSFDQLVDALRAAQEAFFSDEPIGADVRRNLQWEAKSKVRAALSLATEGK